MWLVKPVGIYCLIVVLGILQEGYGLQEFQLYMHSILTC